MDADQEMRQRALELAQGTVNNTGDYVDILSLANNYFRFMKFGELPKTTEADDE